MSRQRENRTKISWYFGKTRTPTCPYIKKPKRSTLCYARQRTSVPALGRLPFIHERQFTGGAVYHAYAGIMFSVACQYASILPRDSGCLNLSVSRHWRDFASKAAVGSF